MLQLVTGRSGSGKTEALRALFSEKARSGETRLLFLVPEQYSFNTERAMLKKAGNKHAQNVEVLSFSRLADYVFRSVGGNAGLVADDGTKLILMLRAMAAVEDRLDFYKRYVGDPRLAYELLAIFREVRQSGAALSALSNAAGEVESPVLSKKLGELALIFDVYDAMFRQQYSDEDLQMEKLCKVLSEERVLEGFTIGIDGFKSFTGQELRLLSLLVDQAADLYVALCTDGPSPSMVFHSVNETRRRLTAMAKEKGMEVRLVPKEELGIQNGLRYGNEELRYLEENLFYPGAEPFDGSAKHITVAECRDIFDECDYIAATARKLLREDGIRARDIAVIVRNEEDYRQELLAAFQRYGLPVYEDTRKSIDRQPLSVLCKTVLSILASGFTSEHLLQYLKTGLGGVSEEEVADLENYVFLWDLKGKAWLSEFTLNPFGLDAAFRTEEEVKDALDLLNHTRERVIKPLLALRKAVKDVSFRETGEAFYQFLIKTDVPGQLKDYAATLNAAGLEALAGEQDRVWDTVIGILDRITAVYGEERCPSMKVYADLFFAVLSVTDLGSIPQGLDEITVSAADRVRLSSPDTVFVAGLEEGVFPAVVSQTGLFTLHERNALRECGLELSFPEDLRASEERFVAYSAASAPRNRLYLSWHRLDTSGGSYLPSELLVAVEKLFPEERLRKVVTDTLPLTFYAETKDSAFAAYAGHLRDSGAAEKASVEAALLFGDKEHTYEAGIKSLQSAMTPHRFSIENPDIAADLFKKDMRLSASKVDNYYHCAFQYFCRYGLNAEPRKRAVLGANNYGTIIHYVLEQLLRNNTKDEFTALSADELHRQVQTYMEQFAREDLGGLSDKTTRFQYLYNRLKATLYDVAERLQEELRHSEFVPSDFELPIGQEGSPVPAYTLELPDGGSLQITGSVDRVDLLKKAGRTYVRVVDYKSGGKEFALSDILYGLNLQMLIYLFAIQQNGTERYENTEPAGILYYPAKRHTGTTTSYNAPKEDATLNLSAKDKQNGLLLEDMEILRAMDDDLAGAYIPVKLTKAGVPDKYSVKSLANLEELGRLHKRIDLLLKKMAENLTSGAIAAEPAEQNGFLPCTYCDFKAVCRPEDPETRLIEPLSKEEVFEQLSEEVNAHGE